MLMFMTSQWREYLMKNIMRKREKITNHYSVRVKEVSGHVTDWSCVLIEEDWDEWVPDTLHCEDPDFNVSHMTIT